MGVIFSMIFGQGRVKRAALNDSLVSCDDCAVIPEVVAVEVDIEVPAPLTTVQYSLESIQEEANSTEGERGGGGEAVQAVLSAA